MFAFNSALTQKRGRAFLTALIVTFFYVTLMLACFFGVGAPVERFRRLQPGILLAGSSIVCRIGIGLVRSKAALEARRSISASAGGRKMLFRKLRERPAD